MLGRERSQISSRSSNDSQNILEMDYQNYEGQKDDLFYGSDEQISNQRCPKLSTTNSLNRKVDSLQQQSSTNRKSRQTRSVFHNFQKHLVITLRQFIKIKSSNHVNEPQSLAWQLWQNFKKQSKIYTKNILQFVFGVVDYESDQLTNVYDEQVVQRFGFSKIFSSHSNLLITQAQQNIRKEVVCQLKSSTLKEAIKKRRIASTDEFLQYIQEFISELQEGPMRKRLPKTKKIEMSLNKKLSKEEIKK